MPNDVTIVIPCFNDEPTHLLEAVDSALAQTFEDTHVIVVDDGSDRAETVQALRALPADVRVLRQPNAGVSAARNAGAAAGGGDLILPLDADDWIDPQFVQEAVEIMADPAVQIAYGDIVLFGAVSEYRRPPDSIGLSDLMDDNVITSASLVRRSRWVEVGGYCEAMRSGYEDYEFWIRVLRDGGQGRRLPTARMHYRIRAGSRHRQQKQDAMARTRDAIVQSNAQHLHVLLQASFERMDALKERLAVRDAQLAVWERRTALLRRARAGLGRLNRLTGS